MRFASLFIAGLLAGTAALPLHAQTVPPAGDPAPAEPDVVEDLLDEEDDFEDEEVIVITAQRERGTVGGDIPPEVQLSAEEVQALGAGSLSELLEILAPETRSSRGRGGEMPVILLNGRRISGFSEIRDIPPEAIERVDILPEEVALRFGYRADQRVVNFVLRERFSAVTSEVEYGFATGGGRSVYEGDFNLLRITGNGRWSVDAEYRKETPLFESERDLVQSPPARPYALGGNVGPGSGASEIDPALSGLAGEPVTIVAVPPGAGGGAPLLSDFLGGANDPAVTGTGAYRTLLGESEQLTLNGTYNRTILGNVSATLNGRFTFREGSSRFGLPFAAFDLPAGNPFSPFGRDVTLYRYFDAFGPLTRDSEAVTGRIGTALNGDIGRWRWSFTGAYDISRNETRTDAALDPAAVNAALAAGNPALNPFGAIGTEFLSMPGRDFAETVNESLNGEAVASGPVVELPGGNLVASLKLGAETRSFTGRNVRGGVVTDRELSRDRVNGQASFDIPIASRRTGFLEGIGNLSANLNLAFDHLSDFGTLHTIGYGLTWSPIADVTLIASATHEEGAPSVQQLGDPAILTPNVRVFDFVRGETVDITRLEGGNPALLADSRRVVRLGANIRAMRDPDLRLSLNYTNTRIDNPIASFPTATPEIEAAFPDRFLRDAEGRLVRIDGRPVNFSRSEREEVRWGANFSMPFGSRRAPEGQGGWRQRRAGGESGAGPQRRPGGGEGAQGQRRAGGQGGFGGRGGGAFGGRGGFGGGQGRIQLSLYHTWRLKDEVLIRDGVPVLDFLNGSAAGSRGGRPEHEVELRAGVFHRGLGARLSANWQSGTFVRGAPGAGGAASSDLFFSDQLTLNLNLFANLGQQRSLVRQMPFLRNSRVSIGINNLFDSRPQVRDATGTTPLSYQPDYLDPLGRMVTISFRKQFF